MSIVTEIMDRLSGINAVKERVTDLTGQLGEMRKVMIEQQKDIAELKGQLKALIQMQSGRR
jgi:archaellum component FlaC